MVMTSSDEPDWPIDERRHDDVKENKQSHSTEQRASSITSTLDSFMKSFMGKSSSADAAIRSNDGVTVATTTTYTKGEGEDGSVVNPSLVNDYQLYSDEAREVFDDSVVTKKQEPTDYNDSVEVDNFGFVVEKPSEESQMPQFKDDIKVEEGDIGAPQTEETTSSGGEWVATLYSDGGNAVHSLSMNIQQMMGFGTAGDDDDDDDDHSLIVEKETEAESDDDEDEKNRGLCVAASMESEEDPNEVEIIVPVVPTSPIASEVPKKPVPFQLKRSEIQALRRRKRNCSFLPFGCFYTVLAILAAVSALMLAVFSLRTFSFVSLTEPLYEGPDIEQLTQVGLTRVLFCRNGTLLEERTQLVGRTLPDRARQLYTEERELFFVQYIENPEDGCYAVDITASDVQDQMWNIARFVAYLSVAVGSFFTFMLMTSVIWESINLKPIAMGLLVCYFSQSLTFFFYDSDLCRQHRCAVGAGSLMCIFACIMWFISAMLVIRMDVNYKAKHRRYARRRRRARRKLRLQRAYDANEAAAYPDVEAHIVEDDDLNGVSVEVMHPRKKV